MSFVEDQPKPHCISISNSQTRICKCHRLSVAWMTIDKQPKSECIYILRLSATSLISPQTKTYTKAVNDRSETNLSAAEIEPEKVGAKSLLKVIDPKTNRAPQLVYNRSSCYQAASHSNFCLGSLMPILLSLPIFLFFMPIPNFVKRFMDR